MTTSRRQKIGPDNEANASFLARFHRPLGYHELRGSNVAIARAPATVTVHIPGCIATSCSSSSDSRDYDDVGRARIGLHDDHPRLRNPIRLGAPVQ